MNDSQIFYFSSYDLSQKVFHFEIILSQITKILAFKSPFLFKFCQMLGDTIFKVILSLKFIV
jgi:hypothetical protein